MFLVGPIITRHFATRLRLGTTVVSTNYNGLTRSVYMSISLVTKNMTDALADATTSLAFYGRTLNPLTFITSCA